MDMLFSPDAMDLRILDALQQDADLSVADLSRKVGLSSTPCWRRLKTLEKNGLLGRKIRLLNRSRLGFGFTAFVNVSLSSNGRQSLGQLERAVMNMPEVVECYMVTGQMDYVMKVVTTDMEAFEHFLRTVLTPLPFIREVHTSVGLTEVKRETTVPLKLLKRKTA